MVKFFKFNFKMNSKINLIIKKCKLRNVLITKAFYNIEEFLENTNTFKYKEK